MQVRPVKGAALITGEFAGVNAAMDSLYQQSARHITRNVHLKVMDRPRTIKGPAPLITLVFVDV